MDCYIYINRSGYFAFVLYEYWLILNLYVFTLNTGNIGNVPLVLIAALCRDKSNPFGDSEKCSTDGTAYISFGQWVGFYYFYLAIGLFDIVILIANIFLLMSYNFKYTSSFLVFRLVPSSCTHMCLTC